MTKLLYKLAKNNNFFVAGIDLRVNKELRAVGCRPNSFGTRCGAAQLTVGESIEHRNGFGIKSSKIHHAARSLLLCNFHVHVSNSTDSKPEDNFI
jgi:hypothetical protein